MNTKEEGFARVKGLFQRNLCCWLQTEFGIMNKLLAGEEGHFRWSVCRITSYSAMLQGGLDWGLGRRWQGAWKMVWDPGLNPSSEGLLCLLVSLNSPQGCWEAPGEIRSVKSPERSFACFLAGRLVLAGIKDCVQLSLSNNWNGKPVTDSAS